MSEIKKCKSKTYYLAHDGSKCNLLGFPLALQLFKTKREAAIASKKALTYSIVSKIKIFGDFP